MTPGPKLEPVLDPQAMLAVGVEHGRIGLADFQRQHPDLWNECIGQG